MTTLNINGHDHSVEVRNETPLLWVIREHLQGCSRHEVRLRRRFVWRLYCPHQRRGSTILPDRRLPGRG